MLYMRDKNDESREEEVMNEELKKLAEAMKKYEENKDLQEQEAEVLSKTLKTDKKSILETLMKALKKD